MATKGNIQIKKVVKKTRKGVHAKTKDSTNMNSKLYKKPYVGQGR